MSTYRERRERKADNLREWADKRTADAGATLERNRVFTDDYAFNTQPGSFPLRRRVIRQNDRALESLNKANGMRSRANGIESQLKESIYSDDVDVIEALERRLEELEAKRERIKAHNKAMRKPGACDHLADCDCRSHFPRDCSCKNHPLPGYVLQNLGGNIKRNRDRLDIVKRQQARSAAAEEAGGVVVRPNGAGYVSVTFAEKPAREILSALKAAGFRWQSGSWWGSADRLPEEVSS
jgi:hypothetical protein